MYLCHQSRQFNRQIFIEGKSSVDDVLVDLVGQQQSFLLRLCSGQTPEVQPVLVGQLHRARGVGATSA